MSIRQKLLLATWVAHMVAVLTYALASGRTSGWPYGLIFASSVIVVTIVSLFTRRRDK